MIDGYQRMRDGEMGFSTRPLMAASVDNPTGIAIGPTLDAIGELPGVAVGRRDDAPVCRHRRRSASPPTPTDRTPCLPIARRSPPTSSRPSAWPCAQDGPFPARTRRRAHRRRQRDARPAAVPRSERCRPAHLDRGAPHDIVGVVADYASNPMRPAPPGPESSSRSRADAKNLRRLQFIVRAESAIRAARPAMRRQAPEAAPGTLVTSAYHVRSDPRDREPGSPGRHGAARSAHRDRHAADDGGDLRGAGVRDHAAVAGARGAHGDRRERTRRRPPGDRAHGAAGRHRRGGWASR